MPNATARKTQDNEIDALHAEIYGGKAPANSAQEPQQPPAQEPAQQAQEAQEPSSDTRFSPATAPIPPEEDDSVEAWRQRFKSLQGKYDSEVPHLRSQIRDLTNAQASLGSLEADDETLKKFLEGEGVSQEDIDEYGDEMVALMRKAARDELRPVLSHLQEQGQHLRESLSATAKNVQASTREAMVNALTARVPNWQEINQDQSFLDWLAQPDLYSGETRHTLLTRAFDSNDAERVILFFKGFLNEQTGQTAGPPATSTAQPTPQQGSGLETLVAPGRPAGTVSTGAQQSGKIWTEAEINQYVRDLQRGKYTPEQAADIDAQIHQAVHEGRLR